jgi:transglutaminase-like putative cysteine protease
MEKKRPQLSLDELHQLRWLLGGILVLVSVWTVFYLDLDVWVLAGLTTAAVLAVLVRPQLPAYLPRLAHQLAFPFIVVFFAWDLYTTGEVLPALIRLDLLLLLYRGISYRKKRDDLQIIVLGLILVVMAGVLTVSLEFAAQILMFTAVTLALLFVITLLENQEAARGGPPGSGFGVQEPARRPPWVGVHWRRLARRLREVADWRVLALGGALFIGVVAVSALLFTIIPRFQLENSFFLDRWMTRKSLTGFSETIRLSDVIDIQQDNTVALRVDVSDPVRIPAVPYWRMVVLDEYRGGIFSTSRRLRDEMAIGAQMRPSLQGSLPVPRGEPVVWTFYLEAGISRYLPLAGPFHLMRFREPQWVYQQYSLSMIALRNEPVTMTAYRVEGMPTAGFIPDRLFGATLRNIQRAQAENRTARRVADERGPLRVTYPLTTLQLPDRADDRQTLQRAVDEITGGAKLSAEEFAARASGWLRARHGYALQVTLTEGERDPVVVWLESGQSGHCELFTAAFTLLARTAGFPTRAITGFKGGDWNAYENYFMVRNSHAHAWCEVYDGTAGWFRVDPTAGTSAMAAGQQALTGGAAITRPSDRSWQARIDAIRILWYRRIVSFDQGTQLALVQSVRETAGSIGAAIRGVLDDAVGSAGRWLRRPWGRRRTLGWLGLVAAAGLTAAWWWRRVPAWWWRVRGLRRRGGADPVRREAGRWLRRMVESRESSAESREVWADLQRLRYGPRATWPEPQAAFRHARRALRTARRSAGQGRGAGAPVA